MAIPERRCGAAALLLAAFAAGPGPARAQGAPGPGPATDLGVESPARRGFFAETSLGLLGTAGGSRGVSFGQPALGMAVGRDLGEAVAVFVQLAIGASRASCFDGNLATCAGADSFGISFVELGVQYGGHLLPRLGLAAKVLGGLAVLTPSPLAGAPGGPVPATLAGPHGGVGVALDYDTHLDHFAVGLDLLARHARAGRPGGGAFGLTSFAMMPRIKYVF